MRVFFLSSQNFENDKVNNGGSQCTFRNYKAICHCFGKENVKFFQITFKKGFKFFRLFNKKEILENAKNMQIVFIDRSLFGSLAKDIKKINPNAKITTFFHNVEFDYFKGLYPKEIILKIIRKIIAKKIIFKNESIACAHSDCIITLNSRDAGRVEELYGRKSNAIIPITFPNRTIDFNKSEISAPPTALFLGSNFSMNNQGIAWFIKKVLPFVDIKLKIAGKDMDKANLPKNDKLEILGYVESLDALLQNADFIVLPLLAGFGMKVKSCEVLMHGKNIIGTGEAFEGYDVDFEKVGARCETAEEFIKAINEFAQKFKLKFNQYSRDLFLEKYSDDIAFKRFAYFLNSQNDVS
jgi:hypothetical protein